MLEKKEYKNGNKVYILENDVLTYYHKHGGLKASGPFIDDMMEGKWIFYRESGELWQEGEFLHNQKHGPFTRYNRDGSVEVHQVFHLGKKVSK